MGHGSIMKVRSVYNSRVFFDDQEKANFFLSILKHDFAINSLCAWLCHKVPHPFHLVFTEDFNYFKERTSQRGLDCIFISSPHPNILQSQL